MHEQLEPAIPLLLQKESVSNTKQDSERNICRDTEGMAIILISNEVKRAIKPFYSAITESNTVHCSKQQLSQQGGAVWTETQANNTLCYFNFDI